MGTTVSVLVDADILSAESPLERVEEVFSAADSRYSLYRRESELSQIAAGALPLSESSEELRQMYELAISWRNATSGAFTPHRGDGVIDLSGLVKGWAIARSGDILTASGLNSWCINAGGDVLTSAGSRIRPWVVGIVDAEDRTKLMTSVVMTEKHPAVATSGSTERGAHIWKGTGESDFDFVQVSVLAPDIVTADVLATAIIAGGPDLLDFTATNWDAEALAVDRNGILRATPGFRAFLPT